MRFTAFLITLAIFIHSSAWSAPAKPRPLAGIGVLSLQITGTEHGGAPTTLALYREPGVGRLADLDLVDFPAMSPAIKSAAGWYHLAVTQKRGDWLKVIYDDSGREGWLAMGRGAQYKSWARYLQGSEARLLNGLRKEFYQLRPAPSSAIKPVGTVSKEKKLRVVELEDSWMLVLVDLENSGWLRWKDDDGRLLISTEK
ncbi:hypothetical protein KI809_13130 [Geobacter pelophilus]|uniref:SH3 domain-containing protein n=1 Tax=Geoanaerobacter pelophilus TaxID=60036 RepID=A0AAW4LB49_9BACT|nr:hypothetical protein [Geoanaerobacter pelophilus]MBT0665244.1 hypothetical protein [Geoanaerobacter pelophilus]